MKFYNYFAEEKTFIEVKFNYSESCRNVYKTFSVYRNGKKSNIKGLDKFLKNEYPDILTANTYFWSPSSNSGGRRYSETKRNGEVENYFIKEEKWSKNDTFYLENNNLKNGESFGIDSENGFFLEYRSERYHFGFVKKYNFDEARIAIQKRRIQNIENAKKAAAENELLKKIFVTKLDSKNAGNCPSGTENFYKSLDLVKKGFRVTAVRADLLLSLRNDSYTNRAIYAAIKRHEN